MRFNARLLHVTSPGDALRHLDELGTSSDGCRIMAPKLQHYLVHVENLDTRAANILKQDMLSIGGEVSLPRNVFEFKGQQTDAVISGTLRHFQRLVPKLRHQPFGLTALRSELEALLARVGACDRKLRVGSREFLLGQRTLVMGILNITPDSFSDGGRFFDRDAAIGYAERMREEGADIIDVGGESTRPGSDFISEADELERVIPVIEAVRAASDIPISIDTSKAGVAERALAAGADMVNDVSAMRVDHRIAEVAAAGGAPLILMHMQGMPKTMQEAPAYDDLMGEICGFLAERTEAAVAAGMERDYLLLDPGIGFGKTVDHNLEIIRRLPELTSLGLPIVMGVSRKRFIGRLLDLPEDDRVEGTAAAVAYSVAGGRHPARCE